jgi:hypothetical protein
MIECDAFDGVKDQVSSYCDWLEAGVEEFLSVSFGNKEYDLVEGTVVYGRLPDTGDCVSYPSLHPPPKILNCEDGVQGFGKIDSIVSDGVRIEFGGGKLYYFTKKEVLDRFTLYLPSSAT